MLKIRSLLATVGAFLVTLGGQSAVSDAATPGNETPGPATTVQPQGPASQPSFEVAQNTLRQQLQVQPNLQMQIQRIPGLSAFQGAGASHVNSGPTGHSNVPGHANFTKTFENPAQQLNPAQIQALQQGFEANFGQGASHVNSGPTGHSNVPGHANFSKTLNPATQMNPAILQNLNQTLR